MNQHLALTCFLNKVFYSEALQSFNIERPFLNKKSVSSLAEIHISWIECRELSLYVIRNPLSKKMKLLLPGSEILPRDENLISSQITRKTTTNFCQSESTIIQGLLFSRPLVPISESRFLVLGDHLLQVELLLIIDLNLFQKKIDTFSKNDSSLPANIEDVFKTS